MASVRPDPRGNGNWQALFHYGGRRFTRSLGTIGEAEARAILGQIESLLDLLGKGRMKIPDGADPGTWIATDGRLDQRPKLGPSKGTTGPGVPSTLGELITTYETGLIEGSKHDSTRSTERVHQKHLARVLGASKPIAAIDRAAADGYVKKRADAGVGRKTIKMELATLRFMCKWGSRQLKTPDLSWMLSDLEFPKGQPKEPFATWAQIEGRIARQKLKGQKAAALWESVYLDRDQIGECMAHVAKVARAPFMVPMFALCAYTGMRKSEMIRAEIEDVDFAGGVIAIREKKRQHHMAFSYRHSPLPQELRDILNSWLEVHPGGTQLVAPSAGETLRSSTATKNFHDTLEGSRWSVLRGFHVFRHSIASILATQGVDERTIRGLLGHMSEATAARYRHLFPDAKAKIIEALWSGGGKRK